MKLLLINPNTNVRTTEAMLDIARASAPDGVEIVGMTARTGAPLITNPAALREAAVAVEALLEPGAPAGVDGVIIAAFGDPALSALRNRLAIPVTGIAEAGMAEAGQGGRRFAIVTTTPDLTESIAAAAKRYGHDSTFLGVELTGGDAVRVTNDPDLLPGALRSACQRAIARLGASAIVVGGGPLAISARRIATEVSATLIEPVPAAVRLAVKRIGFRAGARLATLEKEHPP